MDRHARAACRRTRRPDARRIGPYLAGSPELDPAITIRHLLHHTAGLPDYGGLPDYQRDLRIDPATPWPRARFLAETVQRPSLFAPGAGWAYANVGYMMLKDIVERASGSSFRSLIASLAADLGLIDTAVVETLDDMAPLMSGLTTGMNDDGETHESAGRYHPGWVSHGLIASTAIDTARFLDRLLHGDVLTSESRAAILTPVRVDIDSHPIFRQPAYGLGVMFDADTSGYTLAGHGGGGPGFAHGALSVAHRDGRRATVAVFTNRDTDDVGLDLAWKLLRARLDIDRVQLLPMYGIPT